jgi:hypothetical protein
VGIVGAVAEEDTRAREAGCATRDECAHGEGTAFTPRAAPRAPGARTCMK